MSSLEGLKGWNNELVCGVQMDRQETTGETEFEDYCRLAI